MSSAAAWLEAQITDAPPQLRARMLAEVRDAAAIPDALAAAARACLARVLRDPDGSEAALDLLAADALLTHACAAAAEQGEAELAAFTSALDAAHFQQLLDRSA